MKKLIILIAVLLILPIIGTAQTLESTIGGNINVSALGNGDYGLYGGLGTRYMFTPKFGLRSDISYSKLNSNHYGCDYDVNAYKISLEGVRRIIKLKKYVLLGTAGLGYGHMRGTNNYVDNTLDFTAGATLLRKLKGNKALKLRARVIGQTLQDRQFDNNFGIHSSGINSYLYTLGVGVVFGSKDFKKKKKEVLERIIEREVCCDAAPVVIVPENTNPTDMYGLVFFDEGRSDINRSELVEIYRVVDIMKKNPEYLLEIFSSSCTNQGSAERNLELRKNRAMAVYNKYSSMGVDTNRMKVFWSKNNTEYGGNNSDIQKSVKTVIVK